MEKMTYADTGVDYVTSDPVKIAAQRAAATTDHFVERFGFKVVKWSRGESVFLINTPSGYLGFVIEGLGTKNLVADKMYALAGHMQTLTGKSYYDQVAQCNVAMVVNDMITLGARPVSFGQYLAVGDSGWFSDKKRYEDLIDGTRKACVLARCSWGPGETPTLKDMVFPGTAELAGAAVGWIPDKRQLINPSRITPGDVIVMVESSGIHANGLTMARKIGERKDGLTKKSGHLLFPARFPLQALPDGYLTKLSDGRTYGETLLDPTHIYVGLVEDCLNHGVDIHYTVNITGHGWRKFMRATQPFTYVINKLPMWQPIFGFIQKHGPVDDREAYGNLNMGAGFALYVTEAQASQVISIAKHLGFRAFVAGCIERGPKKVVIKPVGLEYAAETLAVR